MSTFTNPLARWNSRFSAEGYLCGESPNANHEAEFESGQDLVAG